MDKKYLTRKLSDLSKDHDVPEYLIPQLIHLMERYPNIAIRGAKSSLKTDIEKIITNAMKEGNL
ncbi:hypothetical protein UWK_00648 [Desulfocapsa sulfexigens DSM 10523]|jgi:hypothetical protein|uniref:Uncharacterized protein n=1 Tax=Desulfocapsa sulfexigens (strain DSM 10523 / SB164P1) TaxID=1167006 RepID=M1NBP2_DESSD|nr:DNA modification system-associated small protein [Desulfocapsa sulfexigens]AGF77229.1 hypothetical protein UWK_00648 [Desulfocapsa sulfexigens DSM 10523]